jgi:GDP-mannose transporter
MKRNHEVIAAVLSYSLCSGTLVLFNKLVLHHWPYPSLVVCFQLAVTILFIYSAKLFYGLPVDDLQWRFIVPYSYYIVAFAMGVYSNMRSLSISNVETIIVFRALSPCLVAFLDAIFLGREYPSRRSWMALLLIVLGAYGYASFDTKFQTQGWQAYGWPMAYLLIISFEMAYGKRIIRSVDLKTKSGPVLYTNLLGIFPMFLFAVLAGEPERFHKDRIRTITMDAVAAAWAAYLFLLLGCIAGIGIGYSSWWCRDMVSATSFTLIGVMNKCLTVLLNLIIWDQHAPPGGIASLFLCLVGGALYQQAPLRMTTTAKYPQTVGDDESSVWGDEASGTDERADEEETPLIAPAEGMKLRNKDTTASTNPVSIKMV